MKKLWFRRKKYGWGWYPSSWQGYLVLIIYLIYMAWLTMNFQNFSQDAEKNIVNYVLESVSVAIILIAICYLTGETPRWQWGENEIEKQKKVKKKK